MHENAEGTRPPSNLRSCAPVLRSVKHCASSLSKFALMSAETVAKDRFGKLFRCKSNSQVVHQIWPRIELWSECLRLQQWKEDVVGA